MVHRRTFKILHLQYRDSLILPSDANVEARILSFVDAGLVF